MSGTDEQYFVPRRGYRTTRGHRETESDTSVTSATSATSKTSTRNCNLYDLCDLCNLYEELRRLGPDGWPHEIIQAIASAAVDDIEENEQSAGHRRIFRLAQKLKGMPPFAKAEPEELEPIIEEWQRRSHPAIQQRSLENLVAELGDAWERIQKPGGHLRQLLDQTPTPPIARAYKQTTPQRLLTLAHGLAQESADGTFWFDQHSAAEAIGVDQKTVSYWIRKKLAKRGDLIIVQKGYRGQSTTYRLPDDDDFF